MLKLKTTLITSLLALNIMNTALAAPHHFFIQLENRSTKAVDISFSKEYGNVSLVPTLADHTPLKAKSQPYGVVIEPLDHKASFNIIFKGKNECTFKVGFYAPGKPSVDVKGLGCVGGGFDLVENRSTLLLFVSDMDLKK